ncbi:hypothetical protein [Magnetovibrio sp.]|uniref:hypothetical protein n=1 Tax=Magnetovibrio sp. TaxID=2024836 RepID=UPI002F940871
MARAPRTSAASYALFKQRAWAELTQPATAAMNTGQKSTQLYRNCYTPLLDAVPAKVPLAGRDLLTAMQTLLFNAGLTNAGNARRVHIQGGNDLTNVERLEYEAWSDYLGHWAITRLLCCCLVSEPEDLSANAIAGQRGYLHIYAAGGRVENNNWRVAFNIHPVDIPAAVGAVCPILDANADIGHFKVSAPGSASKPDSLIVYMRRRAATYAGIRAALVTALQNLQIQQTFAPMWEEFQLGMAEAAEPPRVTWPTAGHGISISFGRFRCLVTAIAFETALAQVAGGVLGNLTQPQFDARVDLAFPIYGMPIATPHDQNQLALAANNADNQAFMQAFALYKNRAANTYTNVNAVFANRTAYP